MPDNNIPFPWKPIADAPLGVEIEAFQPAPTGVYGRFAIVKGATENGVPVWRKRNGEALSPATWMHLGEKESACGADHPSVRSWNEELESW